MPKRKRNKGDLNHHRKDGNATLLSKDHQDSSNKRQNMNHSVRDITARNHKRPKTENENSDEASKNDFNTISTSLDIAGFQNGPPKSALQQAFLSRLAGSRFRELNEQLYTTDSSSAFQKFQANPQLFDQYHEGFRTQVKSWPVNPVDAVYKWILSIYRQRKHNLNGSKLRIADFGCGDAKLAEKLSKIREESSSKVSTKGLKNVSAEKEGSTKCPFQVHSFDLVANGNPFITPCDMSNVPIPDRSVDIGVFVLALMGTNIQDFILEAHRVLTNNGILKIAEVRSRFEGSAEEVESLKHDQSKSKFKKSKASSFRYSNHNLKDSLLNEFLEVMEKLGFRCTQKDRSNKMFFLLEFVKNGRHPDRNATFTAKPCIYKRR